MNLISDVLTLIDYYSFHIHRIGVSKEGYLFAKEESIKKYFNSIVLGGSNKEPIYWNGNMLVVTNR